METQIPPYRVYSPLQVDLQFKMFASTVCMQALMNLTIGSESAVAQH